VAVGLRGRGDKTPTYASPSSSDSSFRAFLGAFRFLAAGLLEVGGAGEWDGDLEPSLSVVGNGASSSESPARASSSASRSAMMQ
jgi:hypothetical protein